MPISPLHFTTPEQRESTTSLLDAPAAPGVGEWLNYSRPAEFDSISTPVEVPTRDGTVLRGTLFRPGRDGEPAEGRFASIVHEFNPYDAKWFGTPQQDFLAERGYVVLSVNARGSVESAGNWESWFSKTEAEDNYDVIEWLASQPYSDGRVGQVGSSYGSVTTYRVAAMRPPHLEAIVPIISPTNIFAEWICPGGVPTEVGPWWAGSGPTLSREAHAATLKSFEEHSTFDEFWQQAVTTNKLPNVDVPALHIGGYYDIFKQGGFDAIAQRPDKTWLFYGPWMHMGLMTVPGEQALIDSDPSNSVSYTTVLQWFDHWLKHLDGAALPPARIVSYEDSSARGSGSWTKSEQWPPMHAQQTRLYPTASGELLPDAPAGGETSYFVNPYDGPSACVVGCLPTDADQSQSMSEFNNDNDHGRYSVHRTTFTTAEFANPVVVSGPVRFHLDASISAADTYFVSKLEVLTEDGQVLPLETGYLRARMRDGLEREVAIVPGEVVPYVITLGDIHFRFNAGERMRVTIGGGDVPRVLPTCPAGVVTVHHGPGAFVELPLAEI